MSSLSVYGVVATAHRLGVHLTVPGFRSMVSRSEAPVAIERVGRQPFWDATQIREWAGGRRGSRSAQPAAPGALVLQARDLLRDEPEGDAATAYAAIRQLPHVIGRLRAVTAHLEEEYQNALERSTTPTSRFTLAGWIRWTEQMRAVRAAGERSEAYWDELRAAGDALRAARSDLAAARSWLDAAGPWIEWVRREERARSDHETFDAMLRGYMDHHGADLASRAVPVKDWVEEDRRRLAYVLDRRGQISPIETAEHWAAVRPAGIHLEGVDVSYNWELPDAWALPARLSWIPSTGDLYLVPAVNRDEASPTVVPLAMLPHEGACRPSRDSVLSWLRPFEAMSHEYGAVGLLAEELRVREQVQWWGVAR